MVSLEDHVSKLFNQEEKTLFNQICQAGKIVGVSLPIITLPLDIPYQYMTFPEPHIFHLGVLSFLTYISYDFFSRSSQMLGYAYVKNKALDRVLHSKSLSQ